MMKIKHKCYENCTDQPIRSNGSVVEDGEDYLIVEAPLDCFAQELRPFALRVSPTLADKLFHRPGRIYIDKKALLLWMNSKDEFAEFQQRHTSKPRELIIEL